MGCVKGFFNGFDVLYDIAAEQLCFDGFFYFQAQVHVFIFDHFEACAQYFYGVLCILQVGAVLFELLIAAVDVALQQLHLADGVHMLIAHMMMCGEGAHFFIVTGCEFRVTGLVMI